MSKKETGYIYLILSSIGFLLSSASILITPFASFKQEGTPKVLAYVIGIIFWAGLFISLVSFILWNKYRHKLEKEGKENKAKSKIGLIKFFSNKPASTFDAIFLVSILMQVGMALGGVNNEKVTVMILFVNVFAFEMHCVFNGRNYSYLTREKEVVLMEGRK